MKVMLEDKRLLPNFAWILEATDEQVDVLLKEPQRINFDLELVMAMMKAKGNNAHILQLTLTDPVSIFGYIDELFKKYDSVSWVHEDKFHIKRRVLCHQ